MRKADSDHRPGRRDRAQRGRGGARRRNADPRDAGNLELTINGGVKPTALPKTKLAPITLHAKRHRHRQRLPAAGPAGTDHQHRQERCDQHQGRADLHVGKAEARTPLRPRRPAQRRSSAKARPRCGWSSPNRRRSTPTGPLVVFNGGEKGGVTTLFVQAYVAVPTPTALVTTVKMKRSTRAPTGCARWRRSR